MSVEAVKEYLKAWGKGDSVLEFEESCATVDLAASAVGVEPARIAKTLSFKASGDGDASFCILVVAAGDARIDGRKFKECFGVKSKMLSPEEAYACTGHQVGGVCPFAITNHGVRICLDVSLKRFPTVFPACGSSNSMTELTCDELFAISGAKEWVDVCKNWQEAEA